MRAELDKRQWDGIADLIDAGFEVLETEDAAYIEELTQAWDALRIQLTAQGYDWNPAKRER